MLWSSPVCLVCNGHCTLVAFLRIGADENRAAARRPQAISPAGCCLARGRMPTISARGADLNGSAAAGLVLHYITDRWVAICINQNGHVCSSIVHRKAFAVRKSASLKCPPLFHSRVQSAPRSVSRLCSVRILSPTAAMMELVGVKPLHLADARPFCRLKSPLGTSLLRKREFFVRSSLSPRLR